MDVEEHNFWIDNVGNPKYEAHRMESFSILYSTRNVLGWKKCTTSMEGEFSPAVFQARLPSSRKQLCNVPIYALYDLDVAYRYQATTST